MPKLKPTTQPKIVRLDLRLTADEYSMLLYLAEQTHDSPSDKMRRLIHDAYPDKMPLGAAEDRAPKDEARHG